MGGAARPRASRGDGRLVVVTPTASGARAAVATVREALAAAVAALAAAGCDTPRLDAELLLADAMGMTREALVRDPDAGISPAAARTAMAHVRRRGRREPVAYILGRRWFRRLELAVDRRVLIPRPETELLVEVALGAARRGGRVHDVGTGSGAVALALADERPDLVVGASDAAPEAVEVARENAERLGLAVELSVAPGLPPGDHDLVAANLPYVRDDEWGGLAPEIVRHEPRAALLAGPDGLDAIRALVAEAPSGLPLALEHAPAQAAAVRDLLVAPATPRGLDGAERVTLGRAP